MARSPRRTIGVRFAEAIAFLRRRLSISQDEWDRLMGRTTADADAAARDQVEAMTNDLIAAVADAMERGETVESFMEDYERIVAEHGWGEGSDWHGRLIFRMTTQNAYAAGRWEQAQRLQAARPNVRYYVRYQTADDPRVRHNHAQWHGIILPLDHPFWLTHWPPNGFNCRCRPRIITERDIRRYGWTITRDDDPRLQIPPDKGFEGNVGIAGALISA